MTKDPKGIERVIKGLDTYAIILRKEYDQPGPLFFTPNQFSQQLGMLVHPKGKIVERHRHRLVKREILLTQEVLVVLTGRIEISLYDKEASHLRTVILEAGDSILLAQGGHSVKVLEDAKIIEVKQGPYAGGDDKVFF